MTVPAARLGSRVVELTRDGSPLGDTEVRVEFRRHAFGFGNIAFEILDHLAGRGVEGDDALAQLWLDAFDLAVLPFYWAQFEPTEGTTRREDLLRAARWFADRDVRLVGHPLVWHTLAPEWLRGRPLDAVAAAVAARVRREVADFAGLVDTWDLVNEAVIAPVFDNGDNAITPLAAELGGAGLIAAAAEQARATHPGVALRVNDFDLSLAYERLIEEVLELGVPVAGIGLQTHMHQGYRGEDRALEVADRFARFGIPLHFTETTLLSGDLMPPDIVDLNDYVRVDWPSTAAARRGRPRSCAGTTGRSSRIPPWPRSPTGGCRIAARGSTHPRVSCVATAARSPGTTRCATSSDASGGHPRRPFAPTPRVASRSRASAAVTGSALRASMSMSTSTRAGRRTAPG